MLQVLLIDDDEELAAPLASYLQRFDFTLTHAASPDAGLAAIARARPDVLILDVMLPGIDGFELLRRLRRDPATATLPVLMLSARGDVTDRIVGLELGADDYLPKPFEPRELAARLQTILRRRGDGPAPRRDAGRDPDDSWVFDGGLTIDRPRREVRVDGRAIELTSTEHELLVLLAEVPGRVFSRDEILARLRGHDAEVYSRAVDILISRLRRKLEPLAPIKTLRHAGYTFAAVRRPA